MTTNFKNLDYLQIKEALKDNLRQYSEFQDFDFDASSISQLLSLLAYTSAYNGFYLNMVGAEMFLDSAQLRSSVTSRAKAIGYTPSSTNSARAVINFEVDTTSGPLPANPAFVKLTPTDEFISYVDGKPYYFTPDKTYLIEPDSSGVYQTNVTLVEGKRLKFQYVVDRNTPVKQRFEIPNANVDVSTLTVKVKESATASGVKMFSPAGNINLLEATSQVYFLQENENGNFEVYFGEDIVGIQPLTGNIVILEYVVSSGPAANGIRVFAKTGKPTGYNVVKLTTVTAAQDGTEIEPISSIKLLAPLLYEAQDRAVTRNDYEALIRKDNPNIEFVRVWGGEDSVPAYYGKVYAAIKPKTGTRLSVDEKNSIVNRLLKERNVISVEVKIVDPDYLYMILNSKVNFKSKTTTLSANDIKSMVYDEIVEYKNSVLNGFDADFTYSKLLSTIDSVDRSIVGNLTSIDLKKRIYPAFNQPTRFELKFHNEIDRGDSANNISAVNSSGYIYRGVTTYFGDDGQGELYLYRIVDNKKVIIQLGVGTVDYVNGVIVLNALDVQGITGQDFIDVVVKPLAYDVYTPRESILLLEDADIKVFVEATDNPGISV